MKKGLLIILMVLMFSFSFSSEKVENKSSSFSIKKLSGSKRAHAKLLLFKEYAKSEFDIETLKVHVRIDEHDPVILNASKLDSINAVIWNNSILDINRLYRQGKKAKIIEVKFVDKNKEKKLKGKVKEIELSIKKLLSKEIAK